MFTNCLLLSSIINCTCLVTLCLYITGCKPEMQMMYAGSKLSLVNEGGFTKV